MTSPDTITVKEKLALGAGFFSAFFLSQGVSVLAIPYYQMTLGIDPFYLGLVLAVPLLLASSLGTYVGYWTDQFKEKFGTRRPLLFVAALLCAISYGFIWQAPNTENKNELLLYFSLSSFVFYFFSFFYTVPLNSLLFELSDKVETRLKFIGFSGYFLKLGALVYEWIFPLSQAVLWGGIVLGVKGTAWLVSFFVFGCLGLLSSLLIKDKSSTGDNGDPLNNQLAINERVQKKQKLNFFAQTKALIKNKQFVWLLVVVFLQMAGVALCATMDYYLLVYSVHQGDLVSGSVAKGALSSAYAIMSLIAIPLVVALAKYFGEIKALCLIFGLNALGGLLKWFIFVPGQGLMIVADALCCSLIWSAMVVIIPAMVANSSQLDKTSQYHTGLYVSFYSWVLSFSSVFVVLMSGLTLNWIGFSAELGGAQSHQTLFLMRIILSGGTCVLSLFAMNILFFKFLRAPVSNS